MFAKTHRLRTKKDFDLLWKGGRSVYGQTIGIKYMPNSFGFPRFGVVVGTKVHKRSVKRNLVRRRIREAIRCEFLKDIGSFDVAIIAKNSVIQKSYQEIRDEIRGVLFRAGLIC